MTRHSRRSLLTGRYVPAIRVPPRHYPGLCVYCGALTSLRFKDIAVCNAHRTLPWRDHYYCEPDQWAEAR